MRRMRRKKWYGLKRGNDILLVLSSCDGPIEKEYFYHHDIPIDDDPRDQVVELKLTVLSIIE